MFAALYTGRNESAPALVACAQAFSPRVEAQLGGRLVLVDIAGLGRIVGDAHAIHAELRASVSRACPGPPVASSHRPHVTIALAASRIAALLLAVAGRDVVVLPGRTSAAVGALELTVFDGLASQWTRSSPSNRSNRSNASNPLKTPRPCALCVLSGARRLCGQPGGACSELPTIRRWGLATLGDLAALPASALSTRLGQAGVALQRLSRGLDLQPLVPIVEEARFEAALDLEWPIEEVQPLSFVLTRLVDPLSAALERADRAAAAIVTELTLVRLTGGSCRVRLQADRATADLASTEAASHRPTPPLHVRRLELPAPMRDPRVLRTLILLDLESHPPEAGIDRVAIRIEPTPARITQFSLLERAGPQPETIATLVARLTAVMGEGRVGSPALVDSHAPDAFALTPFVPEAGLPAEAQSAKVGDRRPETRARLASGVWPLTSVLRRFRLPVAARVVMAGDRPARVTTDRIGIKGGDVLQCAGPWRSSGGWWSACGPREARAERVAERERAGVGSPRAVIDASACGPPSERRPPRALGDAPRAERDGIAWDRDEYDAALADGAVYRICRDRHDDGWVIEGILD